uniref:7TM_GPCR_Srx domain-containing protein n=1 Tax=Caenorhabditis tropicalis TaxID=1561998 RepID=A0A1I7U7D4_9PELO
MAFPTISTVNIISFSSILPIFIVAQWSEVEGRVLLPVGMAPAFFECMFAVFFSITETKKTRVATILNRTNV